MTDCLIGGKWVPGGGDVLISTDPGTDNDVVYDGKMAASEQVNNAIQSACTAFTHWAQLPLEARIAVCERFSECVKAHGDELAHLITREMGKPLWESKTEVNAMVGKIAISKRAYETRCAEASQAMGEAQSVTRYNPIGVMVVFGPFNLPGHLPNGHIVPALIAGNTVVFKPSEQTPAVGKRMVELWQEAGLPDGVINVVQGAQAVGEALVAHPDINGVLFTGSYHVGASIHRALGGRIDVMTALELGGNNPLVVGEVADPVAAAYLITQSAFITTGQRCVCARRLILDRSSGSDAVLDALVSQIGGLKVGYGLDSDAPFMGPLVSERARDSVMATSRAWVGQGAKDLVMPDTLDRAGAFMTPGLIDVTGLDMPDEECFGPVLQVYRVKDFSAALACANATRFGLSAGLISDDEEAYTAFRESSRAGIVNWNRQITGASSAAPFGGSGLSGNFRPSAFYAADYCAYPTASIESGNLTLPETLPHGVSI